MVCFITIKNNSMVVESNHLQEVIGDLILKRIPMKLVYHHKARVLKKQTIRLKMYQY